MEDFANDCSNCFYGMNVILNVMMNVIEPEAFRL